MSGQLTLCLLNFIQNGEHLLKTYSFSRWYFDDYIQNSMTQSNLFSVRKCDSYLTELQL